MADHDGVTRNLLLSAALGLAAMCGPSLAAAQSQPPPPIAPAPGPPGAQSPAQAPAPTPVLAPAPAPAAPIAPRRTRARATQDAWAGPSAARLAPVWPGLATANLSRNARRVDLDRGLAALTGVRRPSARPSARLTVFAARAAVIRALGLEAERRGIQRMTVDGGPKLRMPAKAGSEVLARELGLVYNQPSSRDGRERARRETMRLADLVYMIDRAREVGPWQRARLERYRDIHLPPMNAARFAVVQAAVWQIGQPYVWGGDWPKSTTGAPWGAQAHGGFDCSGLVWWAFKGSARSSQMALGNGLLGRTADAMAWEKPAERIPVAGLSPGDLVFFGPKGPKSAKGSIGHTGIALGDGWIVHSSGSRGGPSISFLAEYWPSATAWGRRVSQLGS